MHIAKTKLARILLQDNNPIIGVLFTVKIFDEQMNLLVKLRVKDLYKSDIRTTACLSGKPVWGVISGRLRFLNGECVYGHQCGMVGTPQMDISFNQGDVIKGSDIVFSTNFFKPPYL